MTMPGGGAAEGLPDGNVPGGDGGAEDYVPTPVVAVVGRPNVGKSTLVNRILAERVTAQARLAVEAADAVLFVVDAVVGITESDAAVAAVLRRSGKPVVVAANKVDDAPGEPAASALWALGLGE